MAVLTVETNFRATLGGESVRADISQAEQVIGTKVADIVASIAAGATVTLWQSAAHGVSTNPLPVQFTRGFIMVDPDSLLATAEPLDIELASTRNNAVTVTVGNTIFRVDRDAAFMLGASLTGSNFAGIGTIAAPGIVFDQFTRIRVTNPNATDAVIVRLVLFGA